MAKERSPLVLEYSSGMLVEGRLAGKDHPASLTLGARGSVLPAEKAAAMMTIAAAVSDPWPKPGALAMDACER